MPSEKVFFIILTSVEIQLEGGGYFEDEPHCRFFNPLTSTLPAGQLGLSLSPLHRTRALAPMARQ